MSRKPSHDNRATRHRNVARQSHDNRAPSRVEERREEKTHTQGYVYVDAAHADARPHGVCGSEREGR